MKGILCCFVMILQIVSWICVASRLFSPHGHGQTVLQDTNQNPQSLHVALSSKESNESKARVREMNEEPAAFKEVNKIGSSPPSCEHKCYGCIPCEAIQVPTTTNHLGIQYANYEPEGWKCKCGPTFYSP